MGKVLDLLKALYRKKANDPDPVVRKFMGICRSIHDDPELMNARELFSDRFGLPGKEFDELYASYTMALSASDQVGNWNDDIGDMLLEAGFVDEMIDEARSDLRTAVLQRIYLRAAIDGMATPRGQHTLASLSGQVQPRHEVPGNPLERAKALLAENRHAEAVALLEPLAQAGDTEAQYRLGLLSLVGLGTQRDCTQAADWFRRSADQGYAPAQYEIGVMHRRGEGGPRDDAAAVAWYRRASAQDYPPALYNLGAMYLTGCGVSQDEDEGARLTLRAAELGMSDAAYKVAIWYLTGSNPNLPRDGGRFHEWIERAAVGGHSKAQTLYAAIRYQLDADDGQALEWISRALAQRNPVAALIAQEVATSGTNLGNSKVCRYVFSHMLNAAGLKWDHGGAGLPGLEDGMSADEVDRAHRITELIDKQG